ncbi:unnamed protein product [Mytilus coruscus]|uniref:Tc1-like transposase DDE domain-containing protein n=1 Tax=Mytilus coruscus TaxID=42192 RepID=A0A6J8ED24_MYTCO|nr:unnamed protein product [Mytilus coruscus]
MEKGYEAPWVLQNPMRRLVKATGIKQSTLRQYINGNDPVQDVVKSIHKTYVQKTVSKTQKVDDFDKGVVRRTIYDLHKKSQSVTMPKLQEALKKKTLTFPYLQCREQCIYWGFEWFRDTLIPKLPPQSVIVMDNAPYHSHLDPDSRVPNTNSNKSEISAWLEKSNVHYDKK